jgi:hypothetical protein
MDEQAERRRVHVISEPHSPPTPEPLVTLCLSVSYLRLHQEPCSLLLPRFLGFAMSAKTTPEHTYTVISRPILAIPVSPSGSVHALTRKHVIPLTTAWMSIATHQLSPTYIRRLEDTLNGGGMSEHTNSNVLITSRPNATSPHVHLEAVWRKGRGRAILSLQHDCTVAPFIVAKLHIYHC